MTLNLEKILLLQQYHKTVQRKFLLWYVGSIHLTKLTTTNTMAFFNTFCGHY